MEYTLADRISGVIQYEKGYVLDMFGCVILFYQLPMPDKK
jgi:hypothetical protein